MSLIKYAFAVSTSPPEIKSAKLTEHPELRALLAYWERLCGSDDMPQRAEARKEISHLFKYVHLCDIVENGADFRFRLIGEAVFPGLRENLIGMLVSEHPDMGVRLRFPILMREAILTKNPVRGVAIRETEDGSFHAELIWLPFGNPEVNLVMGMTVMSTVNTDICR